MVSLNTSSSHLDAREMKGLGDMMFRHPPGTFALTPASAIAIQAITDHQALLHGRGIDWGSGVGCLAIVAAKIPGVESVLGLEIFGPNVRTARDNAACNGVAERTDFLCADSYAPRLPEDREKLDLLVGRTEFILANPPSSEGDDGFEFRRIVLRGARRYLAPGGVVLLNISYQYGARRIARLCEEVDGFSHAGVLSSTEWEPFDLERDDLLHCLEAYAAEERRGGSVYTFLDPQHPAAAPTLTAQAALALFRSTGESPLTKWQTHLFRWHG